MLFQAHPADGSGHWVNFSNGPPAKTRTEILASCETDGIEVFRNGAFIAPPTLNTLHHAYWRSRLARGMHDAITGASDNHFRQLHHTLAAGSVGNSPTWVLTSDVSEQGILDGIRAGHTFVSQSPEGPQVILTADPIAPGSFTAVMGDVVDPGRETMTLRIRVIGTPGDKVNIYTHAIQENASSDPETLLAIGVLAAAGHDLRSGGAGRHRGLLPRDRARGAGHAAARAGARRADEEPAERRPDLRRSGDRCGGRGELHRDVERAVRRAGTSGRSGAARARGRRALGESDERDAALLRPRAQRVSRRRARGRRRARRVAGAARGPRRGVLPAQPRRRRDWEPARRIATGSGDAEMPRVAAVGSRVVVVWADSRANRNGRAFDVYALRSGDGGATFSAAAPLSAGMPRLVDANEATPDELRPVQNLRPAVAIDPATRSTCTWCGWATRTGRSPPGIGAASTAA